MNSLLTATKSSMPVTAAGFATPSARTGQALAGLLTALLLIASSARAAPTPVVEQAVPAAVQAEVAQAYDQGRGVLDEGGISRVRSFALPPALDQNSLNASLAGIILATADDSPAAFPKTCVEDEDGPAIADPLACLNWHWRMARHDGQALSLIGSDLPLLHQYLFPSDAEITELVSWTSYFSVDCWQLLLIDRKNSVVHVVSVDYGA